MPEDVAAAYCGEKTVEAFLRRVGKDYPAPVVDEGRRKIWLERDLRKAIGLEDEVRDAAEVL
jgi:hypothetical protein